MYHTPNRRTPAEQRAELLITLGNKKPPGQVNRELLAWARWNALAPDSFIFVYLSIDRGLGHPGIARQPNGADGSHDRCYRPEGIGRVRNPSRTCRLLPTDVRQLITDRVCVLPMERTVLQGTNESL